MSRAQPADWGSLSGFVRVRPLSTPLPAPSWTGGSSPFSANLASTLPTLRREVEHLHPSEVLLEADFTEGQLRLDGLPKATARAASPGVILTLIGTQYGDLRYPCSTFHRWDDNLRGVALALEALRKVDRYGVTKRGEQYTGWKALPTGSGPSAARGRALIRDHATVAAALRATHPDTSGYDSADDFADVQAAREAAA